ncbi:MAG: hypothetical protein HQ477_05210 [Chloroflexi bacterium]|jgi:hypothetical protein|nr:hypothetical protein [Chloroflexota bacterium]
MKAKLLTGSGLVALIAVASLIAFNIGSRSLVEPLLGATVAHEISVAGMEEPIEVLMSDITTNPGAELLSSVAGQPNGTDEGIKVHGRWTIEVTEPDGKLVSLNEFDNALTTSGGETLANFLAHVWSVGKWQVELGGNACAIGSGSPANCVLVEPPYVNGNISNLPHYFDSLTVTSPTTGVNSGKLVLTGSATVANDTVINSVSSAVIGCAPSVAPADANCPGSYLPFTAKTLSPTVAVLGNQVVNVTVVISFS